MGIIEELFIEPYIFKENLTATRYLDFLQFVSVASLAVVFSNNDKADVPRQDIWNGFSV